MGVTEKIKGSAKKVSSGLKKASPTSSENFEPSAAFQRWASGKFSLRNSEFITDILNDSRNDPHKEMRASWRMRQNNIQVAQTVDKKALLIIGRELGVDTSDSRTEEYFEEEVIPKLKRPFIKAVRNAVAAGNGHVKVERGNRTGVPVEFKEMRPPHKVYNSYMESSEDARELEIESYVVEAFRNNVGDSFQVLVDEQTHRRVKGHKYDKNEVIHLTIGNSAMPGYGRSSLMSGSDDYKINREMKRAQGIIARHKMFPRKAFVFNEGDEGGGIDEPGDTAQSDLRRQREQELSNLDPQENPVYHDVEVDVKDYSYDPDVRGSQEVMQKIDRDLTSILPPFMSHASDSNRSTSRENRNLLQMEIASLRESVRAEVDPILQEIAKAEGLSDDVTLEFGEFSYPTRDEKTSEVMEMWGNDMIQLGEAVEKLPFDFEVADEYMDKYHFELNPSENPFEGLQQKLDDIEDVDSEELQDLMNDE